MQLVPSAGTRFEFKSTQLRHKFEIFKHKWFLFTNRCVLQTQGQSESTRTDHHCQWTGNSPNRNSRRIILFLTLSLVLLNRQTDRQTRKQTARQTNTVNWREKFSRYDLQQDYVIFNLSLVLLDRQIDRKTNSKPDRETERQTERQTDRETDKNVPLILALVVLAPFSLNLVSSRNGAITVRH